MVLVVGLARRLRKYGIDHLSNHALLGCRQRSDLFKLLMQLRRLPALAGALGRGAEQFFDGHGEQCRQARQMRDRHAALAALVGGDGLLRDAELFGQGAFVVGDGHGGRGDCVEAGSKRCQGQLTRALDTLTIGAGSLSDRP